MTNKWTIELEKSGGPSGYKGKSAQDRGCSGWSADGRGQAVGVGERNRARERDSYMEAVVNALGQGVVIFSRDGSVKTMNRAAVKMHGFEAIDERDGRLDQYADVFELLYPDGQPVPRDKWPATRALKGETVKRLLLLGRNRRNGHSWRGIYSATPAFDENGDVQAAVVAVHDVTDPNRAEAVLARLASMVESSAVPMIGLTRDGIVESWNAAAECLFGYSASEIVGRHVAVLGSCECRQDKVDAIRCVREGGVVHNLETVRIAQDGRKIPVLLTIAPIRDEIGAVVGMSASVIDNTQGKQAELELKEAGRRKDEFLATLAHELRNPLAPMRNAVHLLRMGNREPVRVEQAVSILDRQLEHMVRLIDDLLDMARITRGKIKLRREPMDLRTAITSAVETSRPLIAAHQHGLEVVQPRETVLVNGDLTRLTQVVSNLLNNAARYTPMSGHIGLVLKREGAEAVLSVSDNGIGIPSDALPELFTMFAQVDQQSTRGERGLGIGLALVRGLVEMHGGCVEATSAGPGQGSTFTIRLPITRELPQINVEGRRTGYQPPSLRILVADDNQDAADSTALALELAGHEVKVVYDGGTAVSTAPSFRPDVILLDAGMPVLDGYEAARRIRRQEWGRDVVIFAVTGWGQDADREKSRQAGCDGHMVKPVDVRGLQDAIASEILRRRSVCDAQEANVTHRVKRTLGATQASSILWIFSRYIVHVLRTVCGFRPRDT